MELNKAKIYSCLSRRLSTRMSIMGLVLVLIIALPFAVWIFQQYRLTAGWASDMEYDRLQDLAIRYDSGPLGNHLPTPEVVKGLYVSAAAVGHQGLFGQLVGLAERTEINSFIIDLKDDRSYIAFETDNPNLKPYQAKWLPLGNMRELTRELHDKGLYLIARLPVFQDQVFSVKNPEYAVKRGNRLWSDYRGLYWLDAAAKPVWKYSVDIATEAAEAGFDEIQFDYIRFPSDGNMSNASYPIWDKEKSRADVMNEFFTYLDRELRVNRRIPISVDLFGMTMWNHYYDLNIGQRLEYAARHFDFVSPMVYPSHYPSGFEGLANPAEHPYRIIYDNMVRGEGFLASLRSEYPGEKISTVRPWLQDFDLGAYYGPDKVRAQIDASMEGGASGWILWNAANRYTEAALESIVEVE